MKNALVILCFMSLSPALLPAAGYRAGIARVNITPSTPIWLSGYAARVSSAGAVRSELWAKALALADDSGGRVVIVTTDLIGLPRQVSDAVARRVLALHRLQRSQLLLNSSHTHSGPVVRPNLSVMYDLGPEDRERVSVYTQKLTDDLVRVAGEALMDLRPAGISFARGTAEFAMNRREKTSSGVRIGENPAGPSDHDVPVLKVSEPDGRVRAVLFGYGCHNTTLPGSFNEVDGDYAGFAQREIEKTHGGVTAMFLILCAGDQNPQPRGTYENVAQHGRTLADAVHRVLAGSMQDLHPPLRTEYEMSRLDFAPHSRTTFEKEAADKSEAGRFKARRAGLMLSAYDNGHPVRQLDLPVQAVGLGRDLTILALGGEVVADYSLRVRREFPGRNLVVTGYSNDVSCYLPSGRVLKEGGYEPDESMIYYGQPGPFAPNVEEKVFRTIYRVLRRMNLGSPRNSP